MSDDISGKKKEYPKAKIEELETKSMIKNIRDLNRSFFDYKKVYQPRTDVAKDKKNDLFADCHSILAIKKDVNIYR